MDPSLLKSDVWIKAGLRRSNDAAVPALVLKKGDPGRGTLLLKLNYLNGEIRVLTQSRDLEGKFAWLPALKGQRVSEEEANAYVERASARDPDLWVVEIEHCEGWHPFGGTELTV